MVSTLTISVGFVNIFLTHKCIYMNVDLYIYASPIKDVYNLLKSGHGNVRAIAIKSIMFNKYNKIQN